MKEKIYDVICIGAAIVDLPLNPVSKDIFKIESYPVEQIAMTIGGDAINESTIISRLGYKVSLLSMVGNDVVGDFIIDHCKKNNIEFTGVLIKDGINTSINVGLVTDDGERTFVTNRNGSLWKLTLEDIDLSRLSEGKILSLASIFNNPLLDNTALVKIFKKAKENNMIICADMIKARFGEKIGDIREALQYVDYFFPNYEEACMMTDETDLRKIADKFLSCGVKNIVIKVGKKGCYIKNISGIEKIIPAMKNIKPVDTIGAGDNFVAGFIVALLDGKSIEKAATFANVTASISVESIGATNGIKNKAQVNQRLKKYYAEQGAV